MAYCSPWALLPPSFSICTAAGLWAVYFVALYYDKVVPLDGVYRKGNESVYPPFISVTGQFPPASCIFSEVLNLTAFVAFVIGLLRYVQLRSRLHKVWMNVVSLLAFSAACFGMTLVGNFQLFTMRMVHNVGTEMAFGLGTLYCWMQSYITLKVNLNNEGKQVAIARFLLSGSITLCIILKFFFTMSSLMDAARCQWAVVMLFLVFIGTFGIEFRYGHFSVLCHNEQALVLESNSGDSEDCGHVRQQSGRL